MNGLSKQEYNKQYYALNRDKLCQQSKLQRVRDHDKIVAYKTKPWTCPQCNKTMQSNSQYMHLRVCQRSYQDTTMYKLVSDNLPPEEVYIGHTTQTLDERLQQHEHEDNICESRHIIAAGSYHIIELEKWPCDSFEEALKRERHWFDNIPNINKYRPFITDAERKAFQKEWREAHPDKQKEYEANRNMDKRRANVKQRTEKQKQSNELSTKQRPVSCPQCNKEIRKDSLPRHLRSCKGTPVVFKKPRALCVMCNTEVGKSGISTHRKKCLVKCCNEIMNVTF